MFHLAARDIALNSAKKRPGMLYRKKKKQGGVYSLPAKATVSTST